MRVVEESSLSGKDAESVDAHWRAGNYLSAGQIYLLDNPLLDEPLRPEHVKPRLLGHWGTTPGLNLVYTHLNRVIREREAEMMLVTGPGHGGPAIIANSWLDGSWTEAYPGIERDRHGMRTLFKQFSFPGGVPSHVAPDVPGSIHEGGELGYSLAHAFGAAFDNPGLVVACVIGDGEAETGPLAASWRSTTFCNPERDGAVLPILHLNGYKIANPTVLARLDEDDLAGYLTGCGWEPLLVSGSDPAEVHQRLAGTLDRVLDDIGDIRGSGEMPARWPMIVLRTPKGWTGPASVDDKPVEGTWRSHQVPLGDVREDDDRLRQLEDWLRSYRPDELFDDDGHPVRQLDGFVPDPRLRLGSSPHANGGRLTKDLALPETDRYGVDVQAPGREMHQPAQPTAHYLRDVLRLNERNANFRVFGPDEIGSNRLDALYETTERAWMSRIYPTDENLGPDGRVMEVLSEHLCQGWLEGYLLSGRHGVFSSYEAFVHIVDSMFNQHAKWLKASRQPDWRRSIPSLNYLLTSHVWQQDHNGFSHQDPGFIDHVVNKKADIVRVYLPPDGNTLLATVDHCLRSRDQVNVIVAGKQAKPAWTDIAEANLHATRGIGVWDWASNDDGDPDVVLACAGDVPTVETVAAAGLLREHLPDLKTRVVNVVDLMRLQSEGMHPHGLTDAEFDALFTTDRPVVFAYHGYPWLVHRLTYKRNNHRGIHVRGYTEEGTTTTPFDMLVRNDLDRFHLVIDVIDRVPGLARRAAVLRQRMIDARTRHRAHVVETGTDLPEITQWRWTP